MQGTPFIVGTGPPEITAGTSRDVSASESGVGLAPAFGATAIAAAQPPTAINRSGRNRLAMSSRFRRPSTAAYAAVSRFKARRSGGRARVARRNGTRATSRPRSTDCPKNTGFSPND